MHSIHHICALISIEGCLYYIIYNLQVKLCESQITQERFRLTTFAHNRTCSGTLDIVPAPFLHLYAGIWAIHKVGLIFHPKRRGRLSASVRPQPLGGSVDTEADPGVAPAGGGLGQKPGLLHGAHGGQVTVLDPTEAPRVAPAQGLVVVVVLWGDWGSGELQTSCLNIMKGFVDFVLVCAVCHTYLIL